MLTARQNKYYMKMYAILGTGRGTSEEKNAIFKAQYSIGDSGENFGNIIRKLIQDLGSLELGQKGGLTPKVKELFEDIKKDYGS